MVKENRKFQGKRGIACRFVKGSVEKYAYTVCQGRREIRKSQKQKMEGEISA